MSTSKTRYPIIPAPSPDEHPIIKDVQTVAKSQLFRVEQMSLEFSNGNQRLYERLPSRKGPGAVMVIAMKDDHTVLLTREYCAGLEGYDISLPKGGMDHNETIEEAAHRELQEEVGYGARSYKLLKVLSVSPGYMSSQIAVVLATDLYESRLEGDEPEPIIVFPFSLHDIEALVQQEDLCDGRCIAALYMAKQYLTQTQNLTQTQTP